MIDLPGASIENIKEDAGDGCLILPLSAKCAAGIDTLIESIFERINGLATAA